MKLLDIFKQNKGLLFQENVTVAELQERFAGREWLFHGYNILATLLTVPFSEPRAGVFFAVDALFNGTPVKPWQLVNWVTSAGSTVLIGWIAVGWWRSRDVEGRGLILIGVVVLSLNAALGYLYTRDRIPALAGVYYALLLGTAAGAAWRRQAHFAVSARAGTDPGARAGGDRKQACAYRHGRCGRVAENNTGDVACDRAIGSYS